MPELSIGMSAAVVTEAEELLDTIAYAIDHPAEAPALGLPAVRSDSEAAELLTAARFALKYPAEALALIDKIEAERGAGPPMTEPVVVTRRRRRKGG